MPVLGKFESDPPPLLSNVLDEGLSVPYSSGGKISEFFPENELRFPRFLISK